MAAHWPTPLPLSPADPLPTSGLPPPHSLWGFENSFLCLEALGPHPHLPPKGNCAPAGSRCSCHLLLQAEWTQGDILCTWLTPQGWRPPGWVSVRAGGLGPPQPQPAKLHRPAAHSAGCPKQGEGTQHHPCPGPRSLQSPEVPGRPPQSKRKSRASWAAGPVGLNQQGPGVSLDQG